MSFITTEIFPTINEMISSKNTTTDPPKKSFEFPKSVITSGVKLEIENHPGHSKVPERNISPRCVFHA